MKPFTGSGRKLGLLIITIIWLTGCSEDISMINPGPPVPVVYGIFDLNQDYHTVKLSKSFAGKADPYTLASDRDLVFYSGAQVFLSEGTGSGRIPFSLETDIPRDPGYFPEFPNEIFQLNRKLQPGNYRLTIILPTEQDTLTARFSFISNFKVITPRAGFRRFYFYEDPILFTWSEDPAAGLYEISLNLTYQEVLKSGDSRMMTASFTRQMNPAILEHDQGRLNYRLYSDSFYAFLSTAIGINSAVDYRKPTGLELIITAADTSVARYLEWFHLEIDDKVNPNGNVDGAIGVVGTKYSVPFRGLVLSPRSQDSLIRGRYTRQLDFIGNPDW